MPVSPYDDRLTLREGRQLYFAANGFDERGYTDRWVKLRAGPVTIVIPNTASRQAAVRRHDLHHVLTGYAADWTGEAEIAAWELASGCKHFVAAWVLNIGAMAVGLLIAPRRTLKAFGAGRRARNLYAEPGEVDDAWLDQTIGSVRARFNINAA